VAAAFFDLDKTVIDRASIVAFSAAFRKGGLISRRTMLRALAAQLRYVRAGADDERLGEIREAMLRLTRGWDRQQVRDIVRASLLRTVEPILYAEAVELIEQHRRAGERVYLVSASPDEIVAPLAELLGADGAIASQGEVDDAGRYTGAMTTYVYGASKASAVVELAAAVGIDLARSTAYSDSATDVPMLEAVGRPVVVNPDRALARIARQRDWEVRRFTKPVGLGNRVSARTPVVTGSLALAGAAVYLWRHGPRSRTQSQLRSAT
jgi:HAD superfamily hydrolase (TIGR01490 family)